jgi:hypothetical protein
MVRCDNVLSTLFYGTRVPVHVSRGARYQRCALVCPALPKAALPQVEEGHTNLSEERGAAQICTPGARSVVEGAVMTEIRHMLLLLLHMAVGKVVYLYRDNTYRWRTVRGFFGKRQKGW